MRKPKGERRQGIKMCYVHAPTPHEEYGHCVWQAHTDKKDEKILTSLLTNLCFCACSMFL